MTDTPGSTPQPPCLLPAPAAGDPRLSCGLRQNIANALQRNASPRPEGIDWAQLLTTLGRFLCHPKETS